MKLETDSLGSDNETETSSFDDADCSQASKRGQSPPGWAIPDTDMTYLNYLQNSNEARSKIFDLLSRINPYGNTRGKRALAADQEGSDDETVEFQSLQMRKKYLMRQLRIQKIVFDARD